MHYEFTVHVRFYSDNEELLGRLARKIDTLVQQEYDRSGGKFAGNGRITPIKKSWREQAKTITLKPKPKEPKKNAEV